MTSTKANYAKYESFDSKKLDVFIQLGKDLQEDVLTEMLATYFKTTDEAIDSLKFNFSKQDFKNVARQAHKLKSSSGQLGLIKLHQLCSDLELLLQHHLNESNTPAAIDILNLIYEETHLTTALLNQFLKAA